MLIEIYKKVLSQMVKDGLPANNPAYDTLLDAMNEAKTKRSIS